MIDERRIRVRVRSVLDTEDFFLKEKRDWDGGLGAHAYVLRLGVREREERLVWRVEMGLR